MKNARMRQQVAGTITQQAIAPDERKGRLVRELAAVCDQFTRSVDAVLGKCIDKNDRIAVLTACGFGVDPTPGALGRSFMGPLDLTSVTRNSRLATRLGEPVHPDDNADGVYASEMEGAMEPDGLMPRPSALSPRPSSSAKGGA